MSVAVYFLARTGFILGTDSRVTFNMQEGTTQEDAYPKLVGFDDLPVALAMVGTGAYGGRDFRSLVTETIGYHKKIEKKNNTVEEVAKTFAEVATQIAKSSGNKNNMEVLIGGFSPGNFFGEIWRVLLPSGNFECYRKPGEHLIGWTGCTEAIGIQWWGVSLYRLGQIFKESGINQETADEIIEKYKKACAWGPERFNWGMPLRSAVDLVRHLLTLQINYERFMPGRGRCGMPLQVVAITPEGLTWVDNPFPW